MKKEQLTDAIGQIDDKYIEEAHAVKAKRPYFSMNVLKKFAVATVGICLVLFLLPGMVRGTAHKEAASEAPSAPMYSGSSFSDAKGEYSVTPNSEVMYTIPSMSQDTAAMVEEEYSESTEEAPSAVQNKKLIVTADARIETMEFDQLVNEIKHNVEACGGYMQSSSVFERNGGRIYDAVIRIPADKYDAFAETTKASGNTVYYNESIEDITQQYADLEARIASLEAEESRLMEFYKRAETISELIEIEDRITDLRYRIDSLNSRMKNYDLLTTYSTLTLTVEETKVYTELSTTFGDRINAALTNGWMNFVDGLQDMVVAVLYNLPQLTLLAVLIIGLIGAYKYIGRRK